MKGYSIDNNNTVIRMGTVQITGNIISLEWFKHLRLKNGKTDNIAIVILSDIVYWYRPIEVRDEKTGALIGYRKKFAADKLQREYDGFADLYGYTKDQARDALKRLESIGLIDLELRHPVIDGVKYGNLLYIGLNVDKLIAISTPLSDSLPIGCEDGIPYPIGKESHTNTETTTETTTDPIIRKFRLDYFVSQFGRFHAENEYIRWLDLWDKSGDEKIHDITAWVIKKEIHLENRPSLLDSMETASLNWKNKKSNGAAAVPAMDGHSAAELLRNS